MWSQQLDSMHLTSHQNSQYISTVGFEKLHKVDIMITMFS